MRSSSAEVLSQIGCLPSKNDASVNQNISAHFEENFREKFSKSLNIHIKKLNVAHEFTIEALLQNFSEACDIPSMESAVLSSEESLLIEEYKLSLLLSFRQHIDSQYAANKRREDENAIKNSPQHPRLRRALAYVFTFLGMSVDSIGSFIFSNTMLALIPGITQPFLLGSSILFTLVNASLFYSFEAAMLKKALQVSDVSDATELLIKSHIHQIDATKRINSYVVNSLSGLSDQQMESYKPLFIKMNENLLSKKKIPEIKENNFQKSLKRGIAVFGGLMAAAGGYYMATQLLSLVAVGLIGSPIGWIIIGSAIGLSLTFYAAMRASGIMSMVNPAVQQYTILNKKSDCRIYEEADFSRVIKQKKSYQQDPVIQNAGSNNRFFMQNTRVEDSKDETQPLLAPAHTIS